MLPMMLRIRNKGMQLPQRASQEEGTGAAAAAGNGAVKEPVEKPPTLSSTGKQKAPYL